MAYAAAFGRLCVETTYFAGTNRYGGAAAFGRLCVETPFSRFPPAAFTAAAFGRLCVETQNCRRRTQLERAQPPSGGCVLKPILAMPIWPGITQPPSGGCVLKLVKLVYFIRNCGSRLRAAVC